MLQHLEIRVRIAAVVGIFEHRHFRAPHRMLKPDAAGIQCGAQQCARSQRRTAMRTVGRQMSCARCRRRPHCIKSASIKPGACGGRALYGKEQRCQNWARAPCTACELSSATEQIRFDAPLPESMRVEYVANRERRVHYFPELHHVKGSIPWQANGAIYEGAALYFVFHRFWPLRGRWRISRDPWYEKLDYSGSDFNLLTLAVVSISLKQRGKAHNDATPKSTPQKQSDGPGQSKPQRCKFPIASPSRNLAALQTFPR